MNTNLHNCLQVARDAAVEAGDDFAVETLTGLLAGSREAVASACGIWREGAIESIGWESDRELRIVYETPGSPHVYVPSLWASSSGLHAPETSITVTGDAWFGDRPNADLQIGPERLE